MESAPSARPVALGNAAVARLFPLLPQRMVRGLSARYIAGTTVQEAVKVATRLGKRDLFVTLDVLGESVRSAHGAAAYAGQYVEALAALHEAGLQPHVSAKPSALGSLIDWRLCEDHVVRIAEVAGEYGGLICLDMESSDAIEGTLDLYRGLRERGIENVTMVAQARLHRTRSDLLALASLRPQVRICKGIYPEPGRIAYTDPEAIRHNFVFCLETVLESGGYAEIATHDEALVVTSLERLAQHKVDSGTYEFQMLLGVRQDLAESLAAAGHAVRIYVPYGKEWHQYTRRRFRESPHIVGYVVRAQMQSLAAGLSRRRAAEVAGSDGGASVATKKERVPT